MISYHPAFDPYHTAFRIVRLLSGAPGGFEKDKVRLMDFHLVFPQAIEEITLPQTLRRWRTRSRALANRYWFHGERWLIFARMGPFFAAASRLLYGSHVVDRDRYKVGYLQLDRSRATTRQILDAANAVTLDEELLEFVVSDLGAIPFGGSSGLKHRTGLMEFRYDAI